MGTVDRIRLLRRRMIGEARRATIAEGLTGFTIDQLCEAVSVSRRTFFNHFASKEDVVLGIELGVEHELLDTFATGGAVAADLDPLDAVVALAIEHLRVVGADRGEQALVRDVLEREPSLVARFASATDRHLGLVAAAVASRYGWTDPSDDRARLATDLGAALLRLTAARYLDDADGRTFEEILMTNLRLAKNLAATATTTTHALETTP